MSDLAHDATDATERRPAWLRPGRSSAGTSPDLPERRSYKWKTALLGPPLVSEQLHTERLGKPVALAVLSSDVMSSAAYATESILRILIPAAGLAAFGLVTPVTALLLVVLGVVCLCYRDVVKTYPVSGGSYVVSRENFGYATAQIPGAALLCSYTLTVAVSIAAGVDAILSAFPSLHVSPVLLSVVFVALLTFGNLRGIREAGRVFAVPTYWFLVSMLALVLAALIRLAVDGSLGHVPEKAGHIPIGQSGAGLLAGASVFIFLRGFANGGSAMTGMEAISNAVTVFREPQVRNARQTLVLMATILGALFLAVSTLAAATHALPYSHGTPTVLSQLGRQVFGQGGLSAIPYYSLQFSTALILILGANTSFNGFPLLVSFIAQDAFLPRPLTTRGHRLVYSNGILVLAGLSVGLLLVTRANVASLIPLYACTVFTGFTMAGAGMTRYHLTHPGPRQRRGVIVNGVAFAASLIVTMIFVVTEFTRGAWAVVVVIPLIVFGLSRTHRRYRAERAVLAEEAAPAAVSAPTLPHHVVLLLVDRIDLATARALQLARSLAVGDELRAIHFMIDEEHAAKLTRAWTRLGLDSVALEVMECPDRRLVRAATELGADLANDGRTEVLMVLPRRAYRGLASHLLHDHTADRIVAAVTQIRNVSATIAPFDVSRSLRARLGAQGALSSDGGVSAGTPGAARDNGGEAAPAVQTRWAPVDPTSVARAMGDSEHRPRFTPIGEVEHRQRTRVVGRVHTVRVQPWAGVPTFECTLVDVSGAMTVVFLGRRSVAGISPGVKLVVEGAIGTYRGRLAMLNPSYEFVEAAERGRSETA